MVEKIKLIRKVKPKETCRYTVLNLMTAGRAYYGGHIDSRMSDGYEIDIVPRHFKFVGTTDVSTILS